MHATTTRVRAFQLALVASAAVGLGACSKNADDVASPTAAVSAPEQVAVAPVPAPTPAPVAATPAPVAVAQNDNAYAQGRHDQQRQDIHREQALREPPPRADRDTDVVDQQRLRHEQQVAAAVCRECGVVEAINAVKVQGKTNGVGAVAGGVGGALVGNQIAGGRDRTLGGVAGAIGGGLLGNAIEKHERATTVFDVNVRMDDGSLRTVRESTAPAVGEKVRVESDGLHDRG
jgi:outer membrane lipoprotein SlyB